MPQSNAATLVGIISFFVLIPGAALLGGGWWFVPAGILYMAIWISLRPIEEALERRRNQADVTSP